MRLGLVGAILAASVATAAPAFAEIDCLTDNELRVVVRSVFTRSIGRVLRVCAQQHASLDARARDAATNFLTSYAENMRTNRLAANSIMSRALGDGWETKFDTMLLESTAADEMWARTASMEDCTTEIARVEDMVAANDYNAIMNQGMPRRVFESERTNIPVCK